jgi:hypothetical protein
MEDSGMVTIEQMAGPFLRAGRFDTPEEQALSAATVLRAMRRRSSYSHSNDHLFFRDLLVEVRFRTDYTIEQCKSIEDRVLYLWGLLDVRASNPNAEPSERSTSEKRQKMIAGLGLRFLNDIETVMRSIRLGNCESAQGIMDPDEFEEIGEADGKFDEIAADIHSTATMSASWVDRFNKAGLAKSSMASSAPPENKTP